jgi:hypothetical protein
MNRLPLSSIRQRRIAISGIAWLFPRRLVSLLVVSTRVPVQPLRRSPVSAAETAADLSSSSNEAFCARKLMI